MERPLSVLYFCLVSILFLNLPAFSQTEGVRVIDPHTDAAYTVEGYRKSYAVCVGIDQYIHWPQSECAVSGATAIAEKLEEQDFAEVRLITNEEATRDNILSSIAWLGEVAAEGDRAIIYFSGHQISGFIIPVDCPRESYYSKAISMGKIAGVVDDIKAKHILYIMDCCYSGIPLEVPRADKEFTVQMWNASCVYMITAGESGQQKLDAGGHGIFTESIMRGLDGQADNDGNGVITGTELGLYSRKFVSDEARQSGITQIPQFGRIDGEGEIVFLLDEAPRIARAPLSRSKARIPGTRSRMLRDQQNLRPSTESTPEHKESAIDQRTDSATKYEGLVLLRKQAYEQVTKYSESFLSADKGLTGVIHYGQDLSRVDIHKPWDLDSMTVKNPNYWRANMEVGYGDPRVIFSNACLCAMKWRLDEAGIWLALGRMSMSDKYQSDYAALAQLIAAAKNDVNRDIRSGIVLHDQGRFTEAIKAYDEVIANCPFSAWAHYEKAFSLMSLGYFVDEESIVELHRKVREYNPFYWQAYQGFDKEIIKKKLPVLLSEVIPFVQGEENDLGGLRKFAYGCEKMGLHDISAHALWELLYYDDGNPDEIMNHYVHNLTKLGINISVPRMPPGKAG